MNNLISYITLLLLVSSVIFVIKAIASQKRINKKLKYIQKKEIIPSKHEEDRIQENLRSMLLEEIKRAAIDHIEQDSIKKRHPLHNLDREDNVYDFEEILKDKRNA